MTNPFDTGVPHSARVWNHWLGGTDNFAADRAVGDRFAALYPPIVQVARSSRAFLKRAVTLLAGPAGVRQFLDVGTGIPSAEHTHEIAPGARVVYADHDPLVAAHARSLLDVPGVTYIEADVRDPEGVLSAAALDYSQPVGLILMNVLGHVPDLDEAVRITRTLTGRLAPGSHLVIADGTNVLDGPAFTQAIDVWNANAPVSYTLRHPDELGRFLDGLDVLPPGLVPCTRWRPTGAEADVDEYGAVARIPF